MTLLANLALGTLLIAAASLPAAATPQELPLPPVIWAVEGVESNVYFHNLLLTPSTRHFFDVHCKKGRQFSSRWHWAPEGTDSGTMPWGIEIRDEEENLIAKGETLVRVAPANAGEGKAIRFLAIGDSLTAGGSYTAHLLKHFEAEIGPRVTLLGTRQSGAAAEGNRHEGYSGWSFATFLDTTRPPEQRSPFIFGESPAEARFDFARYLREHCEGLPPDFIVIFLGTNDIFGLTAENRAASVSQILQRAETLIAEIRKGAPAARIGLIAPLPPASQDAFGVSYGSGQTSRTYRLHQQHYHRAFLKQFHDREESDLYIIPVALNFDPDHSYPTQTTPAYAGSDVEVTRQSNALHPSRAGHSQIANPIYAWIKNQLAR